MHENIMEKATELGRVVGQTDEYRRLSQARQRVNDDREVVTLLNRLGELDGEIAGRLERGEAPSEEQQQEYEQMVSELQQSAVYQGLVAAQTNFEKLLARVNQEMAKGMESGSQSRIILPS